jgi:hypothetical protein
MRYDDLDRMLSREDEIVPSSGFVASVMDSVRREAAMPPPIPFPWKWALPGLAAWAFVLAALITAVFAQSGRGARDPSAMAFPKLVAIIDGARSMGLEWIALAMLLAFASVALSRRLAGARA